MTKKILRIQFNVSNKWGLKFFGAVGEGANRGSIKAWPEDRDELAISIATRLNMLPLIIKRIDEDVKTLNQGALSARRPNVDIVRLCKDEEYQLLLDVNLFLFEFNACCDHVRDFVAKAYSHLGCKISDPGVKVKNILEEYGIGDEWFRILKDARNHFAHNAAPYLAVEMDGDQISDVLIMKYNSLDLNDPKNYLQLSKLIEIRSSFFAAIQAVEKHLIDMIPEAGGGGEI